MEHKCKYCKQPKTEAQMAMRGGRVSFMCLECKQSRSSLGAGAPKKKGKKAKAAAPELVLSIPAGGFGVDAQITEEGLLQLTQGNEGAEADNVCLTRREVRELFNTFGEWAIAS